MIRTRTCEWVCPQVVRNANVPHFRVRQAVHDFAAHHRAASNSGADGEVEAIVDGLRRAPSCFAKDGRVDIRIEFHRDSERTSNRVREIVITPGEFGRRGNAPALQLDWPERADAHGAQLPARIFANPIHSRRNRRLRRPGLKLGGYQVIRTCSHAADELCSPRFNRAEDQ